MHGRRKGRVGREGERYRGEGKVKVASSLDPKVELAHFESRDFRRRKREKGMRRGDKERKGKERKGNE